MLTPRRLKTFDDLHEAVEFANAAKVRYHRKSRDYDIIVRETNPPGLLRTRKPKRWIQGALGKPGALHRELGIPAGERIPVATLRKAAKATGKLGSRARLALTLRGFRHATHRHPSHPYLHPAQRKHRRR
jgi:hypothetical protein